MAVMLDQAGVAVTLFGSRCPYCGIERAVGLETCHEHRDLPGLDVRVNPDADRGRATIQAVDTDDDTIYVLREEGEVSACAPWPQMLEALRPDAVRVAAHTGHYRHTLVVNVSRNVSLDRAVLRSPMLEPPRISGEATAVNGLIALERETDAYR